MLKHDDDRMMFCSGASFHAGYRRVYILAVVLALGLILLLSNYIGISLSNDDGLIASRTSYQDYTERELNISIPLDPHTFYGRFSKTEWRVVLNMTNQQVVNPHDFGYIINASDHCKGLRNLLITVIHSAPANYARRKLIRETWSSRRKILDVEYRNVFIVGSSTSGLMQYKIKNESLQFRDIVQEDFLDTYFNLTYKNIMGLKWVHTYCGNAKFVLKSDDDAFVNMFLLAKHLLSLPINITNMFSCKFNAAHQNVARAGTWHLTKEKYKDDVYPPFCPGLTYIMSIDVASKLYKQSLVTPFFPLDDVYVTGILTYLLNIKIRDFSSAYIEWENELGGIVGSDTKIFGHAGRRGMRAWRFVWNSIVKSNRPT